MFVRRSGRLNQNHNSSQSLDSVEMQINADLVGNHAKEAQYQSKQETQPQDHQQHRYFNSPKFQELLQPAKEPTQEKKDLDESMQVSESPYRKVSATIKALEAMEVDKKPLRKSKIPMAVKRKKLNQQLAKILMPKNAVILLNEFKPGCKYKVQSQPGCSPPSFSAEVECDNEVLGVGRGLSKAQAKNSAAENAVRTIVLRTMSKSSTRANTELNEGEANMEDQEDTPENLPWAGLASFAIYKMFSEWQSQSADLLSLTRPVPKPKTKVPNTNATPKKELPPNAAELHPSVVLNMMHQGLTPVEIEREDGPICRVKVAYSVDGKMFTGVGRNKKDARKEAAKAVLEGLHGLTYPS